MYLNKLKKDDLNKIFTTKNFKLVYSRLELNTIVSKLEHIKKDNFLYNNISSPKRDSLLSGGCLHIVLEDVSKTRDVNNPYIFVSLYDYNLKASKHEESLKLWYFEKMFEKTFDKTYTSKGSFEETLKRNEQIFLENLENKNFHNIKHKFEIPDKFNTEILGVKLRLKKEQEERNK
jgi:hypothetical protein